MHCSHLLPYEWCAIYSRDLLFAGNPRCEASKPYWTWVATMVQTIIHIAHALMRKKPFLPSSSGLRIRICIETIVASWYSNSLRIKTKNLEFLYWLLIIILRFFFVLLIDFILIFGSGKKTSLQILRNYYFGINCFQLIIKISLLCQYVHY